MQRASHNRIKLLITLVLCTLVMVGTGVLSSADARSGSGSGASVRMQQPGPAPASGDPDVGDGFMPPPPNVKSLVPVTGPGSKRGASLIQWVRWTGRVWATLYLRAGR